MTTIFIGGSRDVSRFNDVICERILAIRDAGLGVFLGDANGADKAAQRWFAERSYRKVTVFHSGTYPRNNLGNWETRMIIPKSKKKDFTYYATKDLAMAEEADYGFMLWNGASKGTLNNIFNLLERGKKVVVYFSPSRECKTLSQIADLIPLLEHCPKTSMEEFESKIDLAARIAQHQARLNLV